MNRYIVALFSKHKKKNLPGKLKGTWFDEWMSYGYIMLLSSFIFQGMLYANWRENAVKIGIDVVITLLLSLFIQWWVGLLIAHTLNYCLNGQAVCVFFHMRAGNLKPQQFYEGTVALKKRLDRCKYVDAAISYGSLSTGQWHPSSDIDIRFIPKKGELNYWLLALWAVSARMRAFIKGYPLDMYVFTMKHTYDVMSKKEVPIIFKDVHGEHGQYYSRTMGFDEFCAMFRRMHLGDVGNES